MCLVLGKLRNLIPRLVKEDMTVYKVMEISDYSYLNKVRSPYRLFEYEAGKEYRSIMYPTIRDLGDYYSTEFKLVVERGFHSFPTLEEAQRRLASIRYHCSHYTHPLWRLGTQHIQIVKCTIPKGAWIVNGFWNNAPRSPNFVSSRIIFDGLLDDAEDIESVLDDIIAQMEVK